MKLEAACFRIGHFATWSDNRQGSSSPKDVRAGMYGTVDGDWEEYAVTVFGDIRKTSPLKIVSQGLSTTAKKNSANARNEGRIACWNARSVAKLPGTDASV